MINKSKVVDSLVGQTLDNSEWKVIEKIDKDAGQTGGCFSVGYWVEKNNKKCFLKALDFSGAFGFPDSLKKLETYIQAWNYECGLLEKCKESRMKNVITIIDKGTHRMEGHEYPDVFYIIFEEGEKDIRGLIDKDNFFDNALKMRILHFVALGLHQLHMENISHRDIKPSNIMKIEGIFKISDLGRAEKSKSPHPLVESMRFAGDLNYCPHELLYNDNIDYKDYMPSDKISQIPRMIDLYHLGSLSCFLFLGENITSLYLRNCEEMYHPRLWEGSFKEALPALSKSYTYIIEKIKTEFPIYLINKDGKTIANMEDVIKELCAPNPCDRGIRPNLNRFDAQRYVSIFDRLARRVKMAQFAK